MFIKTNLLAAIVEGVPMPCDNVTEIIRLVIDKDDRLVSYKLAKKSCGGVLGQESMLIDMLKGKTTKDIMAIDPTAFRSLYHAQSDVEQFIAFKHFFAINAVLETLTGKQLGGADSPCAVAEISYGNGNLIAEAEIAVDIVTEKIQACGICAGCGVKSYREEKDRTRTAKSKNGTKGLLKRRRPIRP
jgi:hypothetical protein